MSYQGLYNYCEDISQNLGVSVKWVHEGKEYLNLISPNQGITCWSLPFSSTGNKELIQPFNRVWSLSFIFYQQDQLDSNMDQNDTSSMQNSIKALSITDKVAEMFLHKFNENEINTELSRYSEKVNITGYSTNAAIQDTAQLLTGTILDITVSIHSDFDYCCNG